MWNLLVRWRLPQNEVLLGSWNEIILDWIQNIIYTEFLINECCYCEVLVILNWSNSKWIAYTYVLYIYIYIYTYPHTHIYIHMYIHTYTMGFPGGLNSTKSTCSAGDIGLIPGLGRSPGGGHSNQLQYPCLENPHGQGSVVDYSPWGHKESDMTKQLNTAHVFNIWSTIEV